MTADLSRPATDVFKVLKCADGIIVLCRHCERPLKILREGERGDIAVCGCGGALAAVEQYLVANPGKKIPAYLEPSALKTK